MRRVMCRSLSGNSFAVIAPTSASRTTAHATLLAGIVEGVCGGEYARELRARLIEPLGLAGIVHATGMPERVRAEAASVSAGFGAQLQQSRQEGFTARARVTLCGFNFNTQLFHARL